MPQGNLTFKVSEIDTGIYPGLSLMECSSADSNLKPGQVLCLGTIVPAPEDSPFHCWVDSQGTVTLSFFKQGEKFVLVSNNLDYFVLDPSSPAIAVIASSTTPSVTLDHLLSDQILPLVLSGLGNLILHASCVTSKDLGTIAFVGKSGAGKSTLASYFCKKGFRPVADDALQICLSDADGKPNVKPLKRVSFRLWGDSYQAIYGANTADLDCKTKYDVRVANSNDEIPKILRLDRLYLLDSSGNDTRSKLISLLESSFVLDVRDSSTVQRNFLQVTKLAQDAAVERLCYVRDFSELDDVYSKILSGLEEKR